MCTQETFTPVPNHDGSVVIGKNGWTIRKYDGGSMFAVKITKTDFFMFSAEYSDNGTVRFSGERTTERQARFM